MGFVWHLNVFVVWLVVLLKFIRFCINMRSFEFLSNNLTISLHSLVCWLGLYVLTLKEVHGHRVRQKRERESEMERKETQTENKAANMKNVKF